MQLNNLLTKFKKKDSGHKEYFLAVELSDDVVKSAVWEVAEGQTQIVKTGPVKSWDGQDKEKLLAAVDESISAASEGLTPEPTGVIFGLPDSWTEKEVINQDKKSHLKIICESLSLKPLGFVVTNTAVIKFLRIDEGTPVSAIFLQLNSTEINLTLVKLGKILGAEIVGRSGDLGADVEEGLSRFKDVDVLPSRMILYDGKTDFEEDKQQLISYDWEEKLPFIHFPKVEALSSETSIKAISVAGGSEVAQSLGFEIKPPKEFNQKEVEEPETSFGFVQKDAALEPEPELKPEPEPESEPEPQFQSQPHKASRQNLMMSLMPIIRAKIEKIPVIFKMIKINGLIIGLTIVLALLFAVYWLLPTATVTLTFEQKAIEENINVTFDANTTQADFASAILPGEAVTISVESSQSLPTTGTKLVGEAAVGDIVIYNKTSQAKKFPSETILIGPNNLAFSLDEDVTVASRSSQENNDGVITITPGKANAKITARSIGVESNLSADSRLVFKQFSDDDYYAKTSGLSGGSSREVKAVSQKDQDDLLTALTQDLNNKIQSELQNQLGSDKRFIKIEITDKLTQKSFSHNLNEEADTLTLSAKLDYSTLSYKHNDLLRLINEDIRDKIPADFQMGESSEIEVAVAAIKADKTVSAKVSFAAKLIPKLNFEEVKKRIKGKYPAALEDYFMALPGFANAEILIKPTFLPSVLKTLPHINKNIVLEIKSE